MKGETERTKERLRISSYLQIIRFTLFIHHTALKHTRVDMMCEIRTIRTDVL
jgi:hypothetical protein